MQNSYNLRGDRGLSDFDTRHRFVISGLYELPWKGNRLVEGWQLGTIVQLQSGNPINSCRQSARNRRHWHRSRSRHRQLYPTRHCAARFNWRSRNPWHAEPMVHQHGVRSTCSGRLPSGAVFALPVALAGTTNVFHFGNLGRNVLIGPGFNNVDFSVTKNTRLTDKVRFHFRAEFFDIFNRANFGQPGPQPRLAAQRSD